MSKLRLGACLGSESSGAEFALGGAFQCIFYRRYIVTYCILDALTIPCTAVAEISKDTDRWRKKQAVREMW